MGGQVHGDSLPISVCVMMSSELKLTRLPKFRRDVNPVFRLQVNTARVKSCSLLPEMLLT